MAKKEENKVPEVVRTEQIIRENISEQMKKSYLDYAMSVITSRALPDVRDGLKPVHRRIVYAMHQIGLTSSGKFKKSATVVGDVLGNYHPHGDVAVYDTMVGMAQDFTYRYPLIWGQGNFGSIDGDSAAAYRYTEAKMQKITSELLADIGKETVDFVPNYDGRVKEPIVLPTQVPNVLLNGGLGIAVGMATNIPPHNLTEVCNAAMELIDNPSASTKDLMNHIKGPDFPLGGTIFNKKDILEAYETGRGGVVCRGDAEILESDKGFSQIVITSLPFRVNKATLVEKIALLFQEKKLVGLKDLRDESTKDIRVVVELKRGTQPQKILNTLYKNTQLEENFNFNMVMLVDGVPQLMNLKSTLQEFVKHRQQVVRRATEFDLKKAEARAHILEGLKKALDHIDEIIALIKKSKDTKEAHENLMKAFKFSDLQATAILEMKLQKLASLERKKIEDELKELKLLIAELKAILADQKKILKIIKDQLARIVETYGDSRRTKVVAGKVGDISVEDLIPEEESTLILTAGGYIKRTNPSEFKTQKRGGVGVVDMDTKDEDVISEFMTASTHADILFFSSKGKVYTTKMYDIPEGRRATKGKFISNFLPLDSEEKITSVVSLTKDSKEKVDSLMMVTKKGTIKKTEAAAFFGIRSNGLIAITLDAGDELMDARFIMKGDEINLTTRKGQSIRFEESEIRQMGRNAAGVRGVKLGKKDDSVVSMAIITKDMKDSELLVISDNGYGKCTPLDEYKTQGRGGSGIKAMKVTDKTGDVVGARVVSRAEHAEVIAMSLKSQVIRLNLSDVPTLGRDTQGVRIMKLYEGDAVANFVRF